MTTIRLDDRTPLDNDRVVGTNIAGGNAAFGGVLGTAITRIRDVEIARTGLTNREAAAAGLTAVDVTTGAASRAHCFPGAQPMKNKMVVERGTGRSLGAQIVGGEDAGKRIDVLATALWNAMTLAELPGWTCRTRRRSRPCGTRSCWHGGCRVQVNGR